MPGTQSAPALPVGAIAHSQGTERLLASFRALPPGAPVRLAKRTSNLFRARATTAAPGLDVSGLGSVVSVDPQARTADVQGMCTYEDLVDATLPHGLAPYVVPQLKTITLGGAVTGLGIEASSFRLGLPHESVLEMDILTGAGTIVTATPDGPSADLFYGFANSYGSLGYATRLRIALEPVRPFVELTHLRFDDLDELQAAIAAITDTGSHDGATVHYLDGVVFTATESYLTLGRQSSTPGPVSDYTGQDVFYRSIQHPPEQTPKTDRLTIRDYLWRWDTDWFWCSRAFGAQNPAVRRLWPRKYRRSSFYWKLVALDRKYGIGDRIEKRKGNLPRERVVQDVEVPLENTAPFLRWFLRHIPIEPIWLCPLRLHNTDSDQPWHLYPLHAHRTYVNVGFWSAVPVTQGQPEGFHNRLIEDEVHRLGGHKSLYSDSYYTQDQFHALYGGDRYTELKRRYDPQDRLHNLYEKAVRRR